MFRQRLYLICSVHRQSKQRCS